MDLGIKDKVALVAASSKGLGREVACALAQEGVRLSLCARTQSTLHETAEHIRSRYGVEVMETVCDLTDEHQVATLVKGTLESFGTVDILVSNAGGPPPGKFLEHDVDAWRRAVDLNFMSAVFLCQQVVPVMQKNQWGRIVLMTSISVRQPLDGLILSNSVRAATTGLARTLANELGEDNILVHTVCPGFFLTDRVKSLAERLAEANGTTPEDMEKKWASQNVLGRVADPSEFGPLVAFLCSERASYMTGSAIAIDGGLYKGLL